MARIDQQNMSDVEPQIEENVEDPRLRLLRHLVSLLLMVFILSALIITTALVYKLTQPAVKGTIVEGSVPTIILAKSERIRDAHFTDGQLLLVLENAKGHRRIVRYDTIGANPER